MSTLIDQVSELTESEKSSLICDVVGDMKVKDLNNLCRNIEETFGVKANRGIDPEVLKELLRNRSNKKQEEVIPTDFNVLLKDFGPSKIKVIKTVRLITGLGLKDAKTLVDKYGTIKEGVSEDEAQKVKSQLEEVGAVVEIAPV
jgi:large subunit ribosomal protein L7/L12